MGLSRGKAAPGRRGRSWWSHSNDSELKLLRMGRADGTDVMAGGGATDGEGSSYRFLQSSVFCLF